MIPTCNAHMLTPSRLQWQSDGMRRRREDRRCRQHRDQGAQIATWDPNAWLVERVVYTVSMVSRYVRVSHRI